MNLAEKAKDGISKVRTYWKTPPLGKYVAYKEMIAYGVGGMGVQFVMAFAGQIALAATSFLVGNTIGIKPMHLQYMAVLSTLIGFAITIARSYIIDNSRLKMGKFRPWLAVMGIPTVILSVIFVWLPYETMSYMEKAAAVFIIYNLLQCCYPFFQNSYTDLVNVISPNSHERTDIVSVSSIIYSMAPSLTGLFIPMLSSLTGGLNNIRTYRIIHPIVAIVGLLLTYVAVFGTKERIIVAKTHVSHFKFSDAFRAVAKNKYFWITSLAGWLGFLEGAVGVIIGWTFIYGYPEKTALYGIATTLIGNAALWAMIICPFAIRTIGKRNLLIWCNFANIFLIGLLYPLYKNLYALIILYYLNGFVNSFAVVYNPGISADMRDYQQYFTGERIDGMFGAVGIIGSFIGMFTGMVLPAIYQSLGLQDNYDVMEVASFREDMFEVLIIAAVIGAFMNMVPYFFYDLTEVKQRGIVKVLKIRAMFEDYGNGVLRDDKLVEAIDLIDEANRFYEERKFMTTKDDIKKAKHLPAGTAEEKAFKKAEIERLKNAYKVFTAENKQKIHDTKAHAKSMPKNTPEEKAARKAAIKQARAEIRTYKRLNEEISVCDFVVDEMNKYDTRRIQVQYDRFKALYEAGIEAVYNADKSLLKEAKAMPKSTHEERVIRSDAASYARLMLNCKKNLLKYYPDRNVEEPDEAVLEAAENMPEDTLSQRIAKKKAIKAFVNEKSRYIRSVKILLDAKRMLTEKDNFTHLDEIRANYNEAKKRHEAEYALVKEEAERLEAQRKADLERRKTERLAKSGKGGKNND
ncbi:MAG: MFS transporter [Candidatus Fimenecus sp.]